MSTNVTERTNGQNSDETRDTLFMLGGAALVIFGAGLLLSTPVVREYLGGMKIGNLLGSAIPKDLERYLRLRAM
ncbi:MAG TPA: hypothetical protein VGG72_32555 [Bryobacteraceae bacterium]|jgi:hypothetical protein